jgi:hypothetical protein
MGIPNVELTRWRIVLDGREFNYLTEAEGRAKLAAASRAGMRAEWVGCVTFRLADYMASVSSK